MEKLIAQAKNGDMQSLSFLIKEIQVELYNIAKIKISNEDDINDVLQDTIIDIHNGIKKLKNDKLFKTWAVRILLNNCNSLLKKKYKANNIVSYEEYILKCNNIATDEITEIKTSKLNFEEIMRTLSEQEKIIFSMFYQEEYQISEISEILQLNINTIKSILRRGKEKLKIKYKELSDYEG